MARSAHARRFRILLEVLVLLGLWPAGAPGLAGHPNKPPTLDQRVAALETQMVQLQA
jgi:hypothetical protein